MSDYRGPNEYPRIGLWRRITLWWRGRREARR